MRILYYTNSNVGESEIENLLQEEGLKVIRTCERPTLEVLNQHKIDFIVSDRSRYIIPANVIEAMNGKVINLHPSFLPYNRGDQPLLWATVENNPYGVTIHQVNERFDEGAIISQTKFALSESLTLSEAYKVVRQYMVCLFQVSWHSGEIFRNLESPSSLVLNDVDNGSTRSRRQGRIAVSLLPNGWETTLRWLRDNRQIFLSITD